MNDMAVKDRTGKDATRKVKEDDCLVSLVQKVWKDGLDGPYRSTAPEARMRAFYEFLKSNHLEDYHAARSVLDQMQEDEIQEARKISSQCFESLDWQVYGGSVTPLSYFNHSQHLLERAGYERHPLMQESFSLICQYLDDMYSSEKHLSQEYEAVAKEMLSGFSEWFCQAVEIEHSGRRKVMKFFELVTHFPPGKGYNPDEKTDSMVCSGDVVEFDISDLDLWRFHPFRSLYRKHDDLVEYITSRKYKDLPQEMQKEGGLYTPDNGLRSMLCRGKDRGSFQLKVSYSTEIFSRASRGVREKKFQAPDSLYIER